MRWVAAVVPVALAAGLLIPAPHKRVMRLAGDLHSELLVEGDVSGWVRMAPDFQGRAAIVVRGPARLHDLTIDGNGEVTAELPPWNVPFAKFTRGSGILIEDVDGVSLERVVIRSVGGFAVLTSRSRHVTIESVGVQGNGSRNAAGKNNTTGGILLEEGTSDFLVAGCLIWDVLGNGIWTHSLYTSPRNGPGRIEFNEFRTIGRDAVQVGHAFQVEVRRNWGWDVGYPKEVVDATPAALDTAGNVQASAYIRNDFDGVNGKCIDLDGFHDGVVQANRCRDVGGYGIVFNNTNPDMQSRNIRVTENTLENVLYGGIFMIGTGHTVAHNRLLNLNTSHCDGCGYVPEEPDMLDSGIYLGRKAERPAPARGNVVEGNEITGYKMKARCVGRAPGIEADWNVVRGNICK